MEYTRITHVQCLPKTWKELRMISYEEDGQSYFDDHRIYIDKKKTAT